MSKYTIFILFAALFLSCNSTITRESIPTTCKSCEGDGERIIDCEDCRGCGQTTCYNCSGNGHIGRCIHCDRTGLEKCFFCDGRGSEYDKLRERYDDCFFCSGRGAKHCKMCDGLGYNLCTVCQGKGSSYCYECDGDGKKKIECEECSSTGVAEE